MTQVGRATRCFVVPCIAVLALGVAGQVVGKGKKPQTSIEFVVAELFPPRPATQPTETTLASKRTKDLVIAITSSDGGLKGAENSFCVLFQKTETGEPVDVRNVRVAFTLLVGRIQEEPIRAKLTEDRVGRYCGHVSLGKQYHVQASYYAFVLYTDAAGKKRRERLFLSVR